jgi:hypothetical protein
VVQSLGDYWFTVVVLPSAQGAENAMGGGDQA